MDAEWCAVLAAFDSGYLQYWSGSVDFGARVLLYDNQAGTDGWDIFETASEEKPPQSPCHNCEGRCRNFMKFSVFVDCMEQRNEAAGHN